MKFKIILVATLLFGCLTNAQNLTDAKLMGERDGAEATIIAFNEVENPPLARGCKSKWDVEKRKKCTKSFIEKHVIRNINPALAADVKLKGEVEILIDFVIDVNGKVIDVNATGGPEIMNQNAIEVVGLLPDLKPGTKDGKPVNVSYKMPLIISVSGK